MQSVDPRVVIVDASDAVSKSSLLLKQNQSGVCVCVCVRVRILFAFCFLCGSLVSDVIVRILLIVVLITRFRHNSLLFCTNIEGPSRVLDDCFA